MTFLKSTVVLIAIGALALVGCSTSDTVSDQVSEIQDVGAQTSVVADQEIPDDIHTEDSWARLPTVKREDLDEDGQRAFDIIVNPDSRYSGGLGGSIGMWMNSPKMAEHMFPATTYLRFGTEKDQRLTELTIISTCRELNNQYAWTSHVASARNAGLEEEIIDIITYRKSLEGLVDVPGLGDKEKLIIRFAREIHNNDNKKLSSQTFARAMELFGRKGVSDLAGLIGYYNFLNITIKTFDVHRRPGRGPLLPLPYP